MESRQPRGRQAPRKRRDQWRSSPSHLNKWNVCFRRARYLDLVSCGTRRSFSASLHTQRIGAHQFRIRQGCARPGIRAIGALRLCNRRCTFIQRVNEARAARAGWQAQGGRDRGA